MGASSSEDSLTSSKMNGQPGGSSSGSSGHTSRRARRKPRRSYAGWAFDKVLKVAVWYSIVTLVFRCPKNLWDIRDDSPRICKPSLQAKELVWPRVEPYYDQYLSPYTQRVQPYVDQWNEKIYQPGLDVYQVYGAPLLARAQSFSQEQWGKTIQPQLEELRLQAVSRYHDILGPHMQKAQDAVSPYYNQATTSAKDIWELELRPVYRRTAPYMHQIYAHGEHFAVSTALPYGKHVGNYAWIFWTRQIWPHIRVLYGENVEPQLNRITERLGRYRDGKRLEAEIKSIEDEAKISETPSIINAMTSMISSDVYETTTESTPEVVTTETQPEPTVSPVEQFSADLQIWETISVKAVDEGTEDLSDRIHDIASHQTSSQAQGVGEALVIQLEEAAAAAIENVKSRIQSIISDLVAEGKEPSDEKANEELTQAVRAAGQSVKVRAQAIRDWHQGYVSEIDSLVEKALLSTIETIASIRELRLTEIGRRYAGMDIPHREWAKYNDVKKATETWRKDVEKMASEHKDIAAAKEAGELVEGKGMEVAEKTAKELGRLKQVYRLKAEAQDTSDNFDQSFVLEQLERIKQSVADAANNLKEAIIGSSDQASMESATSIVSKKATEAASAGASSLHSLSSKISETASGDKTANMANAASVAQESAQSAASKASVRAADGAAQAKTVSSQLKASAESAYSKASESIVGSETPVTESIASEVKTAAKRVKDSLSEAVGGSEQSSAENVATQVKNSASSVAAAASEVVLGKESGIIDKATDAAMAASESVASFASSIAETVQSSLSSGASTASSSSSTLGSKAASIMSAAKARIEASRSNLHDTVEPSASSAFSVASSEASIIASEGVESASSASSAASSAASTASSRVFGGAYAQVIVEAREPILDDLIDEDATGSQHLKSMADDALGGLSKLSQAVADGMKRATSTACDSSGVTSLASDQYESAMAAASSVLFGTTPGALKKGSSFAEEQYSSAVTAASHAIYGSPAPAFSQVAASVTSVASAAVAAASSRYNVAVDEAAKQYEIVKSQISVQISGAPKPTHEAMFSSANSVYSDSLSAASQRLHAALAAVPTKKSSSNAYESVSSIASSQLAVGLKIASEQYESARKALGAQPTPLHEQYLASAQAAYYQGIGLAHDRYSSFIEAASTAVGYAPTTGYEAYVSAAQETYSAAIAVASTNMDDLLSAARAAIGHTSQSPAQSYLNKLSSQYDSAVSAASAQLALASEQASEVIYGTSTGVIESAGSAASEAIYGTVTPTYESMVSRASENWEALISQASEKVYGAPVPFTEAVLTEAASFAAQATDAAVSQYQAVQSLFSELVAGKEPDFTDSVMSRLYSVYSTGAPAVASSASSYASAAYSTASSYIESVFTPPPALDNLLDQVNEQLGSAVEAASVQVYGTQKGSFERASEAAASAYSDAASHVSEAINGRETGYAEAVQSSLSEIASLASKSLSEAVYGSPTYSIAAAQGSAASVYSSLTSAAAEQASVASAAVSSAVYGEEQGYVESMQAQIATAIASAQSRLEEFAARASGAAADSISRGSEAIDEAASTVKSVMSEATERVKDEL